jgi:hypothetical protein
MSPHLWKLPKIAQNLIIIINQHDAMTTFFAWKAWFLEFSGLNFLIFKSLRLVKLKPKIARLGWAQAWYLLALSITNSAHKSCLYNFKGLARTQISTNKNDAFEFPTFGEIAGVSSDGVKPGSARLRLEPKFFIIAWKAQAEKSAQLDWLNWKKFRLEKLDISWFTECFLGLNKNYKRIISVVKIRSKNQLFQIKTIGNL